MGDSEEEVTPDEAEEEPKVNGSPVIPRSSAQAPRSCDGISNMPCSADGAAAGGGEDTTGSAGEEPAVKMKKSRLKRI